MNRRKGFKSHRQRKGFFAQLYGSYVAAKKQKEKERIFNEKRQLKLMEKDWRETEKRERLRKIRLESQEKEKVLKRRKNIFGYKQKKNPLKSGCPYMKSGKSLIIK